MKKEDVIKRILPQIREKSLSGMYIQDIEDINSFYEEVQDALLWLEGKGLITGYHLKDTDEHYNHIYHATITVEGQDYMDNGFCLTPLPVQVSFNEDQLEAIIFILAKRFGKPDQVSSLKSFIEKAGNAGINALCTESVKYMLGLLPEITKRFS